MMESDSSIEELDLPPKPIPPVIAIDEDEELVINVTKSINSVSQIVTHKMESHCEHIPKYDGKSDHQSPYHWTVDMKNYYNSDWGNEDTFHVDLLQRKMSKVAKLWTVSDKDLFFSRFKKKSMQCRRCLEFGHKEKTCNVYKDPKCFMCGNDGHKVKKCPRTSCLTCGKRTRVYIAACGACLKDRVKQCSRCQSYGHSLLECPDHWRRYHNTITQDPVVAPPASANKPWHQLWCCNCGKKGHDAFMCRDSASRDFKCPFPFVSNYDNSFNNKAPSNPVGEKQGSRYFEVPIGNAEMITPVNDVLPSFLGNGLLPIPPLPPNLQQYTPPASVRGPPPTPSTNRLELESSYRHDDMFHSRYESDMSPATPTVGRRARNRRRMRNPLANWKHYLLDLPSGTPPQGKGKKSKKRKFNETCPEFGGSGNKRVKQRYRQKKSKRPSFGTPTNPISLV